MNPRHRSGLFAVVCLALACAAPAGQFNAVADIGAPMPSFSNLPTTDGTTLSSTDLKEDVVVLVGRTRPPGRRLPRLGAAEDRQHPVNRHDEKPVVVLQFHRDRLPGVEQDLVVLSDCLILVVLDRLADGDDAAGDHGDFVGVGQDDAAAGGAPVIVLANDDALADGLDDVVLADALRGLLCHFTGL